jgi:NADP-dependent 3-hydroxy acid dehydrogenase YdfG
VPTVDLVSSQNTIILLRIPIQCFIAGLGFVNEIVHKHKNAIVFAGARNPASATALHDLAKKHAGRIHVVKLVSPDLEGNKAVAQEIKEKYGHLDVVIANAGLSLLNYTSQ